MLWGIGADIEVCMLRVLLPASLALVFSVCAAAQEDPTDTSVTRSYTPDEFARYAPRTALRGVLGRRAEMY